VHDVQVRRGQPALGCPLSEAQQTLWKMTNLVYRENAIFSLANTDLERFKPSIARPYGSPSNSPIVFSSITLTPNSLAFSSFDPASSPATT
jgi:hypothetical protein